MKEAVMKSIYFNMQAKVYFETEGIPKYLPEIKQYGKKVLIVTGKKFVFETGLIKTITDICSQNGIEVVLYPEVNPEPDIPNVEKGAKICRKEKCDFVLGVGGGSPMDVAKAISVLATNGGKLKDYFGEMEYKSEPLPIVTIPTTCGTGSEVTRYAVIMDKEAKTKKTINSHQIIPKLSILDSKTLSTLPYQLVVATGMDAFSHSAESFLAQKSDHISKLFAKESLKLLWKYLPQIVDDKDNLDIKEKIFLSSLLAGFAINRTGTIIVHGMGYSLTVTKATHHGTANALLLPYVFEYLQGNGYSEEFAELEEIWGQTSNLKDFVKSLGLPSRLKEIGITDTDTDNLTDLSEIGAQRASKNMKVPLEKKEYREILLKAL
jgi:alcohol dehydrogenase class IV